MIWRDGVIANMCAWRGFERKCKSNREIFRAGLVVNHAKRERAGPTAQIAIDGVKLFLQMSVLRVEIMRRAKAPIVIQPIKNRAGDEIIAGIAAGGKIVVQIPVAKSPTPFFTRREGELMKRELQMAVVDVVTHLRFERDP